MLLAADIDFTATPIWSMANNDHSLSALNFSPACPQFPPPANMDPVCARPLPQRSQRPLHFPSARVLFPTMRHATSQPAERASSEPSFVESNVRSLSKLRSCEWQRPIRRYQRLRWHQASQSA